MNSDGRSAHARAREIYELLLDEHREVRVLADRLKGVTRLDELSSLLGEARSLLQAHYTREEFDDGLFDSLEAHSEEAGDELQALKDEHQVILCAVDRLLDRSEKESGEVVAAAILGEAQSLADKIHGHERKETQLAISGT